MEHVGHVDMVDDLLEVGYRFEAANTRSWKFDDIRAGDMEIRREEARQRVSVHIILSLL